MTEPNSQLLIYQSPDGVINIDKNIYKEGELSEEATCKDFLQVQITRACLEFRPKTDNLTGGLI